MSLQGGMCEGIRIVPMLWDVATLRRNKFRDPRIMGAKRARFRKGAVHESANVMRWSIFSELFSGTRKVGRRCCAALTLRLRGSADPSKNVFMIIVRV